MSLDDNQVIVLADSDAAATYQTNLSGWVSRNGKYRTTINRAQ